MMAFGWWNQGAHPPPGTTGEAAFAEARAQMVREQLVARGIVNPRVLEAMAQVPRHAFVPAGERDRAYEDVALPIGHGQTISQPYIVAFMTEALDPRPRDRVLEIGTGSGYQAAVLSALVAEVYSVELVEPLAARAAAGTLWPTPGAGRNRMGGDVRVVHYRLRPDAGRSRSCRRSS